MMEFIWQGVGFVALGLAALFGLKSWSAGRKVGALEKSESERKAAETAMVATAAERLKRAKSGKAPPVDPNNRDAFR